MPLYMDQHILPGVKAKDVAEAHRLDMMVQGEHGCQCMTYWVDEKRGNVFCLIEAPDKESVSAMHQQAHGLVPNKVIEVNEALVESFLGRITDPSDATLDENGVKVFEDSSMRALLLARLNDPLLVSATHQENGLKIWKEGLEFFRETIGAASGREVEASGLQLVASFTSIHNAMEAGLKMLSMSDHPKNVAPVSIAIEVGEPVTSNGRLFGDTMDALRAYSITEHEHKLIIGSKAAELLLKEKTFSANKFLTLKEGESQFLFDLLRVLDNRYPDADFSIEACCRSLAMSSSQLYRKTVAVCGMSPNNLLSKFRLEKAKDLLHNKSKNVSQISFDTGFASPSYFTKCFKKQYGLLPQVYQQMVNNAG